MSSESNKKPRGIAARLVGFTTGAMKIVLPVVVLLGAAAGVKIMMETAPQASRKTPQRVARLVETMEVSRTHGRAEIHVRGEVMAALDVAVSPQVSGEVVEISTDLVPGGFFEAGDVMLVLDNRDYVYAVEQRQTELTQAKANLMLEKGNQDVAAREYEVLDQELSEEDRALVFRQPQLDIAKARVAAAEAQLNNAKLDLERTTVKAPFDALVVSENVDLGSNLTAQAVIANVVGTDRFWVELAVPQSELRWIEFPSGGKKGSEVILRHNRVWGPEQTRTGHVIRLLPELSEQGKMSRLLMAVDDPMSLKPENADVPKLLVGQSLEAEVLGVGIDNIFPVDREYIRENDTVWIMTQESTLEVRNVTIAFQGRNQALVREGLNDGDRIITSNMSVVAEGMPLRDAAAESSENINDTDRAQS